MDDLFRFNNAKLDDPEVAAWLTGEPDDLFANARYWFAELRACGDDVLELIHDACPVVCLDDLAIAYVNVIKVHVTVGFFLENRLADHHGILRGSGKRMCHVSIRPGNEPNSQTPSLLIAEAHRLTRDLAHDNPD